MNFELYTTFMQIALINGKSESDLKLLINLAKKLGLKTEILSRGEVEDIGLGFAIKEGRTKKYIDTKEFVNKIRD